MDRRTTLTSIPEHSEAEEGTYKNYKWVPKSKHEVLKAKYKCLKKLFQIYDANVIGLLPEQDTNSNNTGEPRKRRRRSHRTKTDAGAGTTELSNGDLTHIIDDKESIIITTTKHSVITTQVDVNPSQLEADSKADTEYMEVGSKSETSVDTLTGQVKSDKFAETLNSVASTESHYQHLMQKPPAPRPYFMNPYYVTNRRPKPSRFQCFLQRILGISRSYISAGENMYCASDGCAIRRRRKGIRFRRLRRAKKNKSDSDLKDLRTPNILLYVQSVQKNCLMDMTPRQCPIVGCQMISYGIINYNDHLNLCHFKNRKRICHFCHEGFETEIEKVTHENQHIGINAFTSDPEFQTAVNTSKITNITQTDPEETIPNDKLKKIVSFFDRFNTSMKSEKKDEYDVNLPSESLSVDSEVKVINCMSVKKFRTSSVSSEGSTNLDYRFRCQFCGMGFRFRHQLNLHKQMEHKRNKFTKYNSCPGIHPRNKPDYSEDGRIIFQSRSNSSICDAPSDDSVTKTISDHVTSESVMKTASEHMSSEFDLKTDLTCDPSTNIVYFNSVDTMKKPSVVETFVNKVKAYKWEGCK